MKRDITWPDIYNAIAHLGNELQEYAPDCILTISKGGLIPARLLADHMKIKRIYVIGIESYTDPNKRGEPLVYQPLCDLRYCGSIKHLCIIDDIADSGTSFQLAIKELHREWPKWINEEFKTCSIYYKPQSVYKPDYYYREIDPHIWVNFPWELNGS